MHRADEKSSYHWQRAASKMVFLALSYGRIEIRSSLFSSLEAKKIIKRFTAVLGILRGRGEDI